MRIIAIIALLLLAGCLDSEPAPADDSTESPQDDDSSMDEMPARETVQITVTWDGAYAGPGTAATGAGYDQDTLEVPANSTVELTFVNDDPTSSHDIAVEGFEDVGGDSDTIPAGESITITFNVGAPGETSFYCTIPGHRDNGMEGAFVIV